jgi:hypothetical protein
LGYLADLSVAGPERMLAVDSDGVIVWYDSRKDSWTKDLAGKLEQGQAFNCVDGSVLVNTGGEYLEWRDDQWRLHTHFPIDGLEDSPNHMQDGYSPRDFYVVLAGFQDGTRVWSLWHYLDGLWLEASADVPGTQLNQMVVDASGRPFVETDTGVFRWSGTEWVEPPGRPAQYNNDLHRTAGGQVFLTWRSGNVQGEATYPVYYFDGVKWVPILELSADLNRWTRSVAGLYPRSLYLFTTARVMAYRWDTGGGQLWQEFYSYHTGIELMFRKFAEGAGGIYMASEGTGYVLRLDGEPGSNTISLVAGPLGDDIDSLAVMPDGSLVVVSTLTGRLYHRPRP